MVNREVYLIDPSTRKLVNEGVATVNEDNSPHAQKVLRYELETFVCEGQYEKGLSLILESYLRNLQQPSQPAVWVSGFYGSGKSHLIKMLKALWIDTRFEDGATARGIANLSQNVKESLQELSVQGKRHGGLHAASGTLKSGAEGSVRLTLLGIVFKSVGLPAQYPQARFVMWCKKEGIEAQVRKEVEQQGRIWEEELDNLHVAEVLARALVTVKPELFASTQSCIDSLNNMYPYVSDISTDQMIKAISQALTRDNKFPLTLIALDEVQQYIGEDAQRALEIQEVVEACSKSFGGKLLFIGTGQTAVTGTTNLKKLEGRFKVRIELSDTDVDTVVRKVILAKKPEAKIPIEHVMRTNLGEISRHLANTTLGHRDVDLNYFVQDYPILPVRRRFWEAALRVLDPTGTDSQLRNQLSMIHKAIKDNVDKPIGNVIPADYLYFDAANRLLQSRMLPRKVYEQTMLWMQGTEDQKLMARACGLVFLISKLGNHNKDLGIRATVNTLADLLLENLEEGSASLRSKLPDLLDSCDLLMKVKDEYRIQTEESAAWYDEFVNHKETLSNQAHQIDEERNVRIQAQCRSIMQNLSISQGVSKVPREILPTFGGSLPSDADKRVYVWFRDGWSIDEHSVHADARQAGMQSPTIFVFIPKKSADELRHNLIEYKAASATLEKPQQSTSPDSIEARSSIETIRQNALERIEEILKEALAHARVFQAGGNELEGENLRAKIINAAINALQRLFPQFSLADHSGWGKVYENAKKGAPDALKAVGFEGEVANHPVCSAVLGFIANGKEGKHIRMHYEGAPYGWPGDAIDGALQVLLTAGNIRAYDDRGRQIDPKDLERKAIGKTTFKVERYTISTPQRIQIRKVLQKAGISAKQGEELSAVPKFLDVLRELANAAGGDPPQPLRPNTAILEEISMASGNEQLLVLYQYSEELLEAIDRWRNLQERIAQRMEQWNILTRLLHHAKGIENIEVIESQVRTIEQQRQLLDEPDPIAPLVAKLAQILREQLNTLSRRYEKLYQGGISTLSQDPQWQQLEPEERQQLLIQFNLSEKELPTIKLDTTADILETLEKLSCTMFEDKIAALPTRFEQLLQHIAEILEPHAQVFSLPRRTLKTEREIEDWLLEVRRQLREALQRGPIILQ